MALSDLIGPNAKLPDPSGGYAGPTHACVEHLGFKVGDIRFHRSCPVCARGDDVWVASYEDSDHDAATGTLDEWREMARKILAMEVLN